MMQKAEIRESVSTYLSLRGFLILGTSDIQYIPPLRRAIAKKLNDPQWEDDNVYKHDAGLDTKFDGFCPGLAVDELQYGRPKAL